MPATVDERVVQMRFDNAQFEANASKTMNTIDSLKDKLDFSGLSDGFSEVEKASQKVTLGTLAASAETVQQKFSVMSVAAITAISNIVTAAMSAGKRIVDSLTIAPISQGWNEYELKMGSVQTIMASTGESLQTVNGYLNELNEYADRTIYSFSDMTTNIGKFTNAGVKLEDAVAAIKGISNEAAVSGANANEASRAMYNFAQALSAGYVKLIDWKSIETANMATVEFKQELLNTAEALGTVVKVGEDYKTTTTDNNGKVSDAFNATKNFNEALSNQWMTTEVLVETLKRYTDETTDLGKKAYAAAQDVKTFSQLMDTLKEAVGSGWAYTWEIVFGDFNEAKDLWTQVSNSLGGIIDAASDARNEFLQGGLSTGWKNFVAQGISDATTFQDALVAVADEQVGGISKLIQETGSFEKSLSNGWVTGDLLGKALDNVVNKVYAMSKAELEAAGYTDDQISELYALKNAVDNGSISLDEFAEKINRPSGRENIIESVKNALKGLSSIFTPIKEGLEDLIPKVTADDLYNFTVKLRELTSTFGLSEDAAEGLRNIVSTISKPFKMLFDLIGTGFGIFGNFVVKVGELTNSFLELFSNSGQITSIFEEISSSAIFDKISNGIERAKQAIESFINTIFNLGSEAGTELTNFGSEALESLNPVASIGDILSNIFDTIGNLLAKAAPKVADLGQQMFDTIAHMIDRLSELDFSGVLQSLVAGLMGTNLLAIITEFLGSFGGITELGDSLIPGVVRTLKQIGYAIGDFSDSIEASVNATTLIKVAAAIGILAASLIALAATDPEHLGSAIAALTGLFADLMISFKMFADAADTKQLAKINKAGMVFVKFAASILILSFAVKQLADLEWEDLAQGIIGVGALCAMMVKSVESLTKSGADKKLSKAALGFIGFAAAIRILTSSVKALSELSWEELAKGLIGVGALCLELSLFMSKTDFEGMGISKGIGFIALAASIKILASAVQDFQEMKPEEIVKGLIAIGFILGELMVFVNSIGEAKNVTSTSIGLIILGAAMLVFASAVEKFGQIPIEQLVTGLIAMGVALVEIGIALQLMPSNTMTMGVGLILVAEAMNILSDALANLSNMTWEQIGKGLIAMGVALAEFAIGLNFMKGTLGASAALLVAAAAIAVLSPALQALGQLTLGQIAISLIAIAGAFGILVAAGYLLTPVVAPIVAISGALSSLALTMAAFIAAVALFTAADTANAVSAPFQQLRNMVTIEFLQEIFGLIPQLIIGIFDSIIEAGDHIIQGIATLLSSILTAIEQVGPQFIEVVSNLIVLLLDAIVEHSPEIINAGFDILNNLLEGFSNNIGRIVDTVTILIDNFLNALSTNLPNLIASGAEFILNFIDSLGVAIEEYAPRLASSLIELGGHIITGLVKGTLAQINAAKEAIINVGKAVVDGIKNFLGIHSPSTVFMDIGKNMIEGLINGIKEMVGKAVTAIKNVGKSIFDTITGFFDINSPSVKMKDEVGHYIVEGIAEGITEDMSAEEAAEKKAQNIVNAFKEALDSADLEMTTAELRYKLWKSLNPNATESEAYEAQASELETLLTQQAEKVRLAEGEYKSIVQQFPNDSKKIREAENKWLKEQITMADYATQLSDLNKSYAEGVNDKVAKNKQAMRDYYLLIEEESDMIDKLVDSGFSREEVLASYQKRVGYDPNQSIDQTLQNSETDVNKIIESYMAGVEVTVEFGLGNSIEEGTKKAGENSSKSSKEAGSSVSKDVASGVTGSKDEISNAVSTTVSQGVSEGISKVSIDGKAIGDALVNSLKNSLASIREIGIQIAQDLYTGFIDYMGGPDETNKMYSIGVSLLTSFDSGLRSQLEPIAQSIQTLIASAICGEDIVATAELAFSEFLLVVQNRSSEFVNLGDNLGNKLVDGIIDAIKNRKLEIVNTMVAAIEEAVRKAQQAASMAGLGGGSGTGSTVGLGSTSGKIATSVMNGGGSSGGGGIRASTSSSIAGSISASTAKSILDAQARGERVSQEALKDANTYYNYTQNIVSPTPLSRSDIYRDSSNLFAVKTGASGAGKNVSKSSTKK